MAARMTAAASALTFFRGRLRRGGNRTRAAHDKAYLKSDLRFWGADLPAIRAAVREYCRAHSDLTRADLRAIAETLYATNVHELRASAIGVLECHRETLIGRDLSWLVDLVRRSKSWAYVDWIAPKVVGDVIARDPGSRRYLEKWAKDESFWVRRAALLAEHDTLRAGQGDFALWSRLAEEMLDEREVFIRKAIGWVLREVSKKRPELTYEFLRKHRDRVSNLSLQEGAKYLPAARRSALGLPAQAAWIAREKRRKAAV
ncbi:MAG TPA: DNA alkylation repair protein [Candidatus Limnocylindria bacterium]|nr:DNA alkylation repair protein [Candidatus Limnocylindria bacterium]